MRRILELHRLHDYYNEKYFGGKLLHLTILLKKSKTKDGYYSYRAHSDWRPIRSELERAFIAICEGCDVEPTLAHEMVHQYQCEVLDCAPHHDAVFKSICRGIERQEGLRIIR
jgi:hypothetical protein